jgi:hypothetical protein
MAFCVYKSSMDGIGGSSGQLNIKQAAEEISYAKGWESLDKLRAAILKWGKSAKPGAVFCTAASVIVCASVEGVAPDECDKCGSDHVEWGDINGEEGGQLKQESECIACGHRWIDTFTLTERYAMRHAPIRRKAVKAK